MAPRAPETLDAFMKRMKEAVSEGGKEVRFGQSHFSHAVCLEDGRFRVRRLESTKEDADAYMKEHGIFMPEHEEMIAKPVTLVYDAESLDALETWLKTRWPL